MQIKKPYMNPVELRCRLIVEGEEARDKLWFHFVASACFETNQDLARWCGKHYPLILYFRKITFRKRSFIKKSKGDIKLKIIRNRNIL